MDVQSITKNIPMSAQKMREVVRQIQGLNALQAQAILAVVPRKSARFVAKTLSSALANAEHIRSEWNLAKIEQAVVDLQGKLGAASDRKKRGKYTRELAMYQSFLDSKNKLAAEKLWVKEALAQTATTMRRVIPKARGSAGPIRKRSCHIRIVLSDK
jgi:large subunit ribosomal protein L22